MRSHGECQADSVSESSYDPLSEATGCRLSWHLGDHLRRLDTVTLTSKLADSRSKRTLSVFDPDGDTYLVRLKTAVGRERYREIPKAEFDPILERLPQSGRWNRVA